MEESAEKKECVRAPAPPALSSETLHWWEEMVSKFDMEPHHLELLRIAAEALDEYRAARAVIAKDGQSYSAGRGLRRARPEVAIAHNARLAFIRAIRELNLPGQDAESVQDELPFDNN
jgi:hypothetical protein